jgi:hypothetical protein
MRGYAVLIGALLPSAGAVAADNGAGMPGAQAPPKVASPTLAGYQSWFAGGIKEWLAPRIAVGGAAANPVRLNRQNARGPRVGWVAEEVYWGVTVERAGRYKVTIRAPGTFDTFDIFFRRGDETQFCSCGPLIAGRRAQRFKDEESVVMELEAGRAELTATVTLLKSARGVHTVEVEYLGPVGK